MFFDDILIYSTSKEKYHTHLAVVLQVLKDNHMFAKENKCAFRLREIEYLDHVISDKGVAIDPLKMKATINLPSLKNEKELRGFLRLTGYYKKIMSRYDIISKPLINC
jgi:hypothetical protein